MSEHPTSNQSSPELPALPEWDPEWSTFVVAETETGPHRFHVLDTIAALQKRGIQPTGTIVAVHGNPTWSYLWRHLAQASVERAKPGNAWRVVAPDQLDMGFSDRMRGPVTRTAPLSETGQGTRRLATRIRDLNALITALEIDGPIVTHGHDWGGVISLGWAMQNPHRVAAITTLNTAVHHDGASRIPAALELALAGPVLGAATVTTSAFLDVTLRTATRPIAPDVRRAFRAPYRSAAARHGIGGFVADIPVPASHPSHDALDEISSALSETKLPMFIQWGPKDPVFQERYLADLKRRVPHADLHRHERAGHLVSEDRDTATPLLDWLDATLARPRTGAIPLPDAAENALPPLWAELDDRAHDRGPASVDMTDHGSRAVSWHSLSSAVDDVALGFRELGMREGDRVSLLVPPSADLMLALYACIRIGAVVVVADAGLGIPGMTRAIRAAAPQWIIGETPGLTLARAARWPGRRVSTRKLGRAAAAALGIEASLGLVRSIGRDARSASGHSLPPAPPADADAAILYTSGSTGPAKGVRYTHGRLSALAKRLREQFGIHADDSLVAGFPPFALLGPALGIPSVTPDMSVTKPGTLTAKAVANAARTANATLFFGSPAALRNVIATADELGADDRVALDRIRLVLSAGAPVSVELMADVRRVFPAASVHSPYGMTECLLVTDIDEATARSAAESSRAGVCVGRPVDSAKVRVAPFDADGMPTADPVVIGGPGEVLIHTPHMLAGYDRLWHTDRASRRDSTETTQWHRTGDVGRIDERGRLWIDGRIQHIITTPAGVVTPVGIEQLAETVPDVVRACAVGVGPRGTQSVCVVVEAKGGTGLASVALSERVRDAIRAGGIEAPVAAVLVAPRIPTDIRHNSKVDRTRVAAWAARVLSGGRVGAP